VRFARVVGTTVSTVKDPALVGTKLLLCVQIDTDAADTGERAFVAVDNVGAGVGEVVLIAEGSAARIPARLTDAPTDATVVGIVDSIQREGATTYRKGTVGSDPVGAGR
jgi:ethanolamine utilization protein EutN